MAVDPWREIDEVCTQARERLRAAVEAYCDYHDIIPAFHVTKVFDRPRAAAHWDPTRPLVVSSLDLVDLDDDEAWKTICPVRHRWWDVDLYPDLAATRGIVGLTTSTELGDSPAVAPGGVVVHTGSIEIG